MTTIEHLKYWSTCRNDASALMGKAAAELEALQREVESLSNELALRIGDKLEITSLRDQNQTLLALLAQTREYVESALKSNQHALKDADPDSQFYGEDIVSMPLLTKIDQALAQSQEGKS